LVGVRDYVKEQDLGEKLLELRRQIQATVALPPATLELVLIGLFARGHLLIDGIPGVGKTLLARTLAQSITSGFKRIQFTNDLLPSDIVGVSVYRPAREVFEFVPGPLFANVVLADEINRTSPRTLSCLLQAMESAEVSVEGTNHELPDPFFVIATRNPIEFHGTFPLPEATLDRFLIHLRLEYPARDQEIELYLGQDREATLRSAKPVLTTREVADLQRIVEAVHVSEPVATYCWQLADATRRSPQVNLGASPRAALALLRAARARAFLAGRSYVLPDDLKELALPVLCHRLITESGDSVAILEELVHRLPVAL
jgi:MoxR-like ATPase